MSFTYIVRVPNKNTLFTMLASRNTIYGDNWQIHDDVLLKILPDDAKVEILTTPLSEFPASTHPKDIKERQGLMWVKTAGDLRRAIKNGPISYVEGHI